MVSQPVCLGVRTQKILSFILSDNYLLLHVRSQHPIWWKDWSVVCSASLTGPSCAGPIIIYYCLIWDSPNLEGQVPVFISPRKREAQLYSWALFFLAEVKLRLMVIQPVHFGFGLPRSFSVWQLRVFWCGAPFLMRGRVCNLLVQLLLGLASAVTLGSKSSRAHDHILLSQLWLPQLGGPGPCIYIPQEQGGPVIPK
jgi:hypothetical protein